jgi:DNA (cytosine-5)-methyltransferase 1
VRSIEICAGAGGQALGLEQAGFEHAALVETDPDACATLRLNRPRWDVVEGDVGSFSAASYKGVDLLAGGVPCPPFSVAGKQLGRRDERDLFPEALRLVGECDPRAVMLENVRGLFAPKFFSYRNEIIRRLENLGYACFWDVFNACDYGVPQLRPRSVLVALKHEHAKYFSWPVVNAAPPQSVGRTLLGEMSRGGWPGAAEWALAAKGIAPTLVGGSKKHGGPDLGPTRARLDWEKLGVDGRSIADEPPFPDFVGMPKLTVKMAALIQGFPPEWMFSGKKTAAYKQVGNAFPPPVAKAMGRSIVGALKNESTALVRAGRLPVQKRLFPAEPPSKSLAG